MPMRIWRRRGRVMDEPKVIFVTRDVLDCTTKLYYTAEFSTGSDLNNVLACLADPNLRI